MSRSSLVVIKWRDIPAQVMAKRGRETVRIELPPRFSTAVDRAAMAAGRTGTDEYLEDWNRDATPCGDDLESEAAAAAKDIDTRYSTEVLNLLVSNDGYEGTP